METQDISTLQQTAILRGLDTQQLEQLYASNEIRILTATEFVFTQGDAGNEMYVLLEGEAHLMVDPAMLGSVEEGSTELRHVHTFQCGESFGEMAIIDGSARSGAVKTGGQGARFLVLNGNMFTEVLRQTENQSQAILNNIIRDVAAKVRNNSELMTEHMLSGYFISVLVEELSGDTYHVDPIVPLQRTMVVRDADSFMLAGPGRMIEAVPEKEVIELFFFAERSLLQYLIGDDDPSGAIIFNALFSLIREGQLSKRINSKLFRYQVDEQNHRRRGTLEPVKAPGNGYSNCRIEWQVKGAEYDSESGICSASLFLFLSAEGAQSTSDQVEQVVESISMPVQKHFYESMPPVHEQNSAYRIMIIHHRTHEVAHTLKIVRDLGYQLDTFMGIPYGDVDWPTMIMLNGAADGNYMSLKVVNHPTEPTHYEFDFRQSSFLDTDTERSLMAIYHDSRIRYDYFKAMQALAEFRLKNAIETCRSLQQKLIIYEDGAYIVGMIYDIYFNPAHALHALVKDAVDDGTIVGVVEVTVAGERKHITLIKNNNGQSLLPVLSNARSDIKAIFEAMGVSEAVTYGAATALGRLGLPTFQTRRVCIIGANGAIGTRVIEQFTASHNSAANVFAVDITPLPFSMDVDKEAFPHAAIRLKYHDRPRFRVEDDCFPEVLNLALSDVDPALNFKQISTAVKRFLTGQTAFTHLAVTDSYPLPTESLHALWSEVVEPLGYEVSKGEPLESGMGISYYLQSDNSRHRITFLRPSVVLTFSGAERVIQTGVDTVIGVTGLPIFSARDLDSFLIRENPSNTTDELVLISGSSKDYEFRNAIDILDTLLTFCSNRPLPVASKLALLVPCYAARLSFLAGSEFDVLAKLFAQPITQETLISFKNTEERIATKIGMNDENTSDWPRLLVEYVGEQIRKTIDIRKDIRPDVGTVYHLMINGQPKRVVMLADGFVINFFARHEKGVKTEFIDPVITMQLLSLVRLSGDGATIDPALYKMEEVLKADDIEVLWKAVDDRCRPLFYLE